MAVEPEYEAVVVVGLEDHVLKSGYIRRIEGRPEKESADTALELSPVVAVTEAEAGVCLLYTSPSPRD